MGDVAVAAGDWLVERTGGWVCTWREYLLDRDEADLAAAMRLHGSAGRPMGEEGFIKKLERRLARKLLPGKPGRPKKPENQYAARR